jgi:hypothetical protein
MEICAHRGERKFSRERHGRWKQSWRQTDRNLERFGGFVFGWQSRSIRPGSHRKDRLNKNCSLNEIFPDLLSWICFAWMRFRAPWKSLNNQVFLSPAIVIAEIHTKPWDQKKLPVWPRHIALITQGNWGLSMKMPILPSTFYIES